ncbi:MAG: HIT family protein [Patescibacteria group bacterium]
MENCIFCKIIRGEAEAKKVYEDESVLAFFTHGPVSKGHTLVIPKEHCENILDISSESLARVMEVTRELAGKMKVEMNATGVNVLHAAGADAQQSVFHFHLHIVPRYPNDGLDLWYQAKIEKE